VDRASGREPDVLVRLAPARRSAPSFVRRRRGWPRASSGWPITCSCAAGALDAGAAKALLEGGKSLLPIGVVEVQRRVRARRSRRGAATRCDGREIARGLINYASSRDAGLIMRKPSSEIESILGFVEEPELIHRDNLILLADLHADD
jgi:glutamate 5-kinase